MADWIGSAEDWFPYRAPGPTLEEYWHRIALPQARRAVVAAGVIPSPARTTLPLAAIVPGAKLPSPMQDLAVSIELSADDGAIMVLIEDQTGSGKTEAALLLAHRLMAARRADGLFIALPTMATANAMYARLRDAYRLLFADGAQPSLVLAHGRRALHDDFRRSILDRAATPQAAADDPAEDTASAQCAAWIADDRRRSFLADVGVGTIDQALLAVLPTRHAPLRLHGLRRRVLIIDEAHAYDAYMREELYRLVEFQAALGGSIIILSATLPLQTRNHLIAAFRRGAGGSGVSPTAKDYPLATTVTRTTFAEVPCSPRAGLVRRVSVERVGSRQDAVTAIAAASAAGMAVAWVCNAVDDAIEAAALLAEVGIRAELFHARFAIGDRLDREEEVLTRFGKASKPAERCGRVLVATQVVEQSLDLDFDLIVSDLAPIDLLIQRAGRLWRHSRVDRPCQEPRLMVLSPEPVATPDERWLGAALRRTGFVYPHHGLLWLTARTLFMAGEIAAPGDVRRLVETVYATDADLPAGLERSTSRAIGMVQAQRSLAWQNLLEWSKGYSRDAGAWDSDVRTPTRLGEEQIVLRLARWEDGRLAPWCQADSPTRMWALSEVSVARRRVLGVPAAARALAAAVTAMRASWRAWDAEIPILPLRRDGPGWVGDSFERARRHRVGPL